MLDVAFLIVSEGGNRVKTADSGIPIHARCEGTSEIAGCFVSEELANRVTVKAPIDLKRASASEIRALRQRMIDFVGKRQAK